MLIFTVNPLYWLFFSDYGSLRRWRGKDYGGYKTDPLKIDPEGRISIREAGREIHGKMEGNGELKWDIPSGPVVSSKQDIKIENWIP